MLQTLFLKDLIAQVFSKKERNLYFLLLIFFFALYMPGIPWLYNVCMWVLFAYSFFFNSLPEKWALLKQRKAMLIILFFFVLNCASALWSNNVAEGISWVGIRLSLLFFPVAIGSIYIKQLLRERILFAFVVATCTAAVLCLLNAIKQAVRSHDASLLYNDNLSGIVNLQSIYMAMLVNLALFSFAYLYIKKSTLVNNYTLVRVALVLLPVHFLLASRIAIIILYGSVLVALVYLIIYRRKYLQGLLTLGGLFLAAFVFFSFFPKTLNRFKELGYTKFSYSSMGKESHFNMELTPEQWNGANLRIAVWQCAWTVIHNNMWMGTGLGDKMDELKKQYAVKGFEFGIVTNRNVHNTYLDVWMSMGLTGLVIFISGFFIWPYAQSISRSDWWAFAVISCFCLSLFSETYLDRTMGNTLIAFFLSLIAAFSKPAQVS